MNRYKYTKQDGSKYLTTKYPKIEPKDDDVIVDIKYGDRLDLYAQQYYGDSTLWWIIAKANGLPGDSYYINTEQTIRIPIDYINVIKKLRK